MSNYTLQFLAEKITSYAILFGMSQSPKPFRTLLKHPGFHMWVTLTHPTPLRLKLISLRGQEKTINNDRRVCRCYLRWRDINFVLTFMRVEVLFRHSELLFGKTYINNKYCNNKIKAIKWFLIWPLDLRTILQDLQNHHGSHPWACSPLVSTWAWCSHSIQELHNQISSNKITWLLANYTLCKTN